MELLILLQKIRNPVLDNICLFLTVCGQDVVLMFIFCTLYWCENKKYAIKIGLSFMGSALIIQTMKIICTVPRPWLIDDSIKPLESAKKGATGYSFPSGHTQAATSIYGTIAWNTTRKFVKIMMFLIIIMVAFSRLYLGVHTPLDVTASMLVTLIVVVGINYLIDSEMINKVKRDTFFAIILVIPVITMTVATIRLLTHSVDVDNCMDLFKTAGSGIGFIIGWYLDELILEFDEKVGSIKQKVIRLTVGLVMLLIFKFVLNHMFKINPVTGFLIYGFIMFWTAFVYPYIFTKFRTLNKINNKK